MRSFVAIALIAVLASAEEAAKPRRVSIDAPCRVKPDVLPLPKVHTPLKSVDLPDQWLWNDVNGDNLLTVIRQQHIP